MKKSILLFFCIIFFLFSFAGCGKDNEKSNNSKPVELSQSEIDDAIETATKYFESNFKGSDLKKFKYNKEQTEIMNDVYKKEGKVKYDGENYKKVMVLSSKFHVNSDTYGCLNSNSDYFYDFVLVRNSKNGKWKVEEVGYF